jgi:hypothetical protein
MLVSTSVFADGEAGLKQLMAEFSRVASSEATYHERKHIEFLDSDITQNGRLSYIAPGHVVRELISPISERFEANEDKVTVDRKNVHRQISLGSIPAVAAFIESFRGTLSGDLDLLRQYYVVRFSGGLDAWKLDLVPTQKEMKRYVSQIVIEGKSTDISKVEIYEQNGDWSRLTLTTVNRRLRER